jgi:pimeloyl-ACP methyl ester carboxylesterase
MWGTHPTFGYLCGCMNDDRLPRQFCTFEGQRLAYVQLGAGSAVLLLHGLGGTADFWQPIVADLARTHMVICPDLLGFGLSDKPHAQYTPALHARAVAAVLRATGTSTLHAIVGHSCGGVVAVALLAAGAAQTDRLVLAAAPYPSPHFPVRQELLKSPLDRLMLAWTPLAHLVHLTFSVCWPLLRHFPVPDYLAGAWAGYMEHTIPSYVGTAEACLFQADLEPLLPALQDCPALLLYGEQDRTVPLIHGQRLHAALMNSQLKLLTDGHYAVLHEGRTTLVDWITSADRGAPSPLRGASVDY